MSKITKLLRNPLQFFQDAARKHFSEAPAQKVLVLPEVSDDDGLIPTYMVGFTEWKEYLSAWFPTRRLIFLSKVLPGSEFNSKYRKRILAHPGSEIFVWGHRVAPFMKKFIDTSGIKCTYVEDGFIRSIDLGATHALPFSLTFDSKTPYFDSTQASDLEGILSTHDFAADTVLMERAQNMLDSLLESGLSKYNQAVSVDLTAVYGPKDRKRILVIGQVEDDASILLGCTTRLNNNDLVMIAASENPGAQIIYKPHPDVLNGHRKALSNQKSVAHLCLTVTQDIGLAQALQTIDHVYTITSQAGFEALLRGIPVTTMGCPFYAGWGLTDQRQANTRRVRKLTALEVFAAAYLLYPMYFDPMYKKQITAEEVIPRLIQLREMSRLATASKTVPAPAAEDPRIPTYMVGFTPWKIFLKAWFPDRELIFLDKSIPSAEFLKTYRPKILANPRSELFIWGHRVSPFMKRFIAASNIKRTYVEDGFLRSIGLGAAHTEPFSLTLDTRTPYFDATQASDMEVLLNTYDFAGDPELIARAQAMIETLLSSGLSKYNQSRPVDIQEVYGPKTRARILVVGQVEDDASIQLGCSRSFTNNDLVTIAATENPGAQIIYKPHPDVLNGHRKALSPPSAVAHLCQIIKDIPLAQSFETIDRVYTITSQAGFEALLRGIPVTTMGCPFYAGWGLTDARQPNARRTRTLTVLEVFAAAYLLYPIYFDPLYKKRLTAEEAVIRLGQMRDMAQLADKPAVVSAATVAAESVPVSYAFGLTKWREMLNAFLPDREIKHLKVTVTEAEFKAKHARHFLSDVRTDLLVDALPLPAFLSKFVELHGTRVVHVGEGFIALHESAPERPVKPFSLVIDGQTAHCDASRESDLEKLLATYDFDADEGLLQASQALLDHLVKGRESGPAASSHDRPRVLVLGHVENNPLLKLSTRRNYTNADLVRIAAMEHAGCDVVFRADPHAGTGTAAELSSMCLVLDADVPLDVALQGVECVITVASIAGFEAALRGVKVVTLGCPFYSGWGITDDRHPNERRTRVLSVLQVFAASCLLYPKYYNPVYKQVVAQRDVLINLARLQSVAHLETLKVEVEVVLPPVPLAPPVPPILTFVVGSSRWSNQLTRLFPERRFTFLPKLLAEAEFTKSYQPKIVQMPGAEFFILGHRVERYLQKFITRNQLVTSYLDDGFVCTVSAGTQDRPSFSVLLDKQAPHFDPRKPSDLEQLLAEHDFQADPELMARASLLLERLVASGLSRYNETLPVDINALYGPKDRARILIIGSPAGDAAVKVGCEKHTASDLVTIAVIENPGAQVIYKPHASEFAHPDSPVSSVTEFHELCHVLEQDVPMAQAFQGVDHVYTIASPEGFEALLRDIRVTVLGAPFYSGWGFTDDRQLTARRERRLTVLEVFAAAYLLYPKYFDPIYKVVLTPEEAVDRLCQLRALGLRAQRPGRQVLEAVAAPSAPDADTSVVGSHAPMLAIVGSRRPAAAAAEDRDRQDQTVAEPAN